MRADDTTGTEVRELATKAMEAESKMLVFKPYTRDYYSARRQALAAFGEMAAALRPEVVLALLECVHLAGRYVFERENPEGQFVEVADRVEEAYAALRDYFATEVPA